MKATLILVIMSFWLMAQNKKSELELYTGKVKAFARTNPDFTNRLIDTVVGQTRTILINSGDSLIDVGWQLENEDPRLYPTTYKIEKEFKGTIIDQKTLVESDCYNYIMFDSDNYPLKIIMADDKSYCNICYYWDSKQKAFMRTEKVILTKIPQ